MQSKGHSNSPLYKKARSLIREINLIGDLIMWILRKQRQTNFERFLDLGYLWPEDKKIIASDYSNLICN